MCHTVAYLHMISSPFKKAISYKLNCIFPITFEKLVLMIHQPITIVSWMLFESTTPTNNWQMEGPPKIYKNIQKWQVNENMNILLQNRKHLGVHLAAINHFLLDILAESQSIISWRFQWQMRHIHIIAIYSLLSVSVRFVVMTLQRLNITNY